MDIKEKDRLKEEAEDAFSQGRYEEALHSLEAIKAFGDQDPEVYLRLADTLCELGETESALSHYRSALLAYVKLGLVLNAISVCKLILKLDPSRLEVLDELSDLYLKLDRAEEGAAEGDRAEASSRGEPSEIEAKDGGQWPVPESPAIPGKECFPETPIFSGLPREEFMALIGSASRLTFQSGEDVFKCGNEGLSIYVIISGSADILSPDTEGSAEVKCSTLSAGEFFGEFGFFSDTPRSATVRAATPLELLELTRSDLKAITSYHPELGKVLFSFYKERVLDRLLAVSAIFRTLTPEERKMVMERVWVEVFVQGMEVVREGDEGDAMYLVKSGVASVATSGKDGSESRLATLAFGDSFGQLALTHDTVRTATITAKQDLELVVFSRPLINEILSGNEGVSKALAELSGEHLSGMERLGKKLPNSVT